MNSEHINPIQWSLRGLVGSLLLDTSKYATRYPYHLNSFETRARHVFERIASIWRRQLIAESRGSLGSFLYNVREMSKYVIYGQRVGTNPQDPLNPASIPFGIPGNGSFLERKNTGNSHPDFPGVGGAQSHLTIHIMRLL